MDEEWGYIDAEGKRLIKPAFAQSRVFREGYAAVFVEGKWGYIDKKGDWLIRPQFDQAKAFGEGFAVIKQNGL